jgi:hypothetical protein
MDKGLEEFLINELSLCKGNGKQKKSQELNWVVPVIHTWIVSLFLYLWIISFKMIVYGM